VPGDEELSHRDQGVEERTHAHEDQQDLGDLAAEIRRIRIRPDRRDGVQGEQEAAPYRDVLEQRPRDGAGDQDQDDEAGQRRQASQKWL
jgi:hypothetical protein